MKKLYSPTLAALFIFGLIAAFFSFYFPTVAGTDNYYHIRHAWIYQTQGIFNSDFPWLKYSVIGQWGGDIWYGFHILLIPFTFLNNIGLGLRLAALLITFTALTGFYFVFKKLGIRWPFLWSLFFFFSMPDVNFRLLMVRPHILTFILTLAIFYTLTQKRSPRLVFLLSVAVSFIHLAMAWLPVVVAILVAAARRIIEGTWEVKRALSILAGLALGWLLRPDPIGAIRIAYVQVVQLAWEKLNHSPLRFGVELRPGNRLSVMANEIIPLALVLTLITIILIVLIKKYQLNIEKSKQVILASSLVMAVMFGLMTYGVARRAADVWAGFGFIFIGLTVSIFWERYADFFSRSRMKILIGTLVIFLVLAVNTLRFTLDYFKNLPPPDAFRETATWLKENTEPGDIVFNIHWDNFPLLFFWNQHNYYINGMDPIFEYVFNKSLYLKHYFIAIDKISISTDEAYTCGSDPCRPETVVSIHDVLKNDFQAKYVFVQIGRNPVVFKYLDSNPRFEKVFSNSHEAIFQVL